MATNYDVENQNKILVVDDSTLMLETLSVRLSSERCSVITCKNPFEAIEKVRSGEVHIVLTDMVMPELDGINLIQTIRRFDLDIPIIAISAKSGISMAVEAMKKGASDFFTKPINYTKLSCSIDEELASYKKLERERNSKKSLIVSLEEKNKALAEALSKGEKLSLTLIDTLTTAAEFRDNETGAHIKRIGLHAECLAKKIKMDNSFTKEILFSSPLHDIGKIGIPDNILLKETALTETEFELMKSHTTIGNLILSDTSHPNLKMAGSIALYHHEKWDGSGYPQGLKGEDIPIEARITVICDIYDAMRSKRPYKEPMSHQETIRELEEGNGWVVPDQFDDYLLKTFIKYSKEFDEIFEANQ